MKRFHLQISVFVGLLALFYFANPAQAVPFVNAAEATSPTTALEIEDLRVMSALARPLAERVIGGEPDSPGSFVVVQMESDIGEVKNGMFLPGILVEDTTDTLVLHLKQRNRQAFVMDHPVIMGDVTIVGSKTADRIVKEGKYDEWFPVSKGFIYMWLPGYNEDKTRAMVYMFHTGLGDGMSSWGGFYYLRKVKREWLIEKQEEAWRT